jgi:hypothetical protein
MLRIDWANPKVTLEQFELFLGPYLAENYDGLLQENNYVYVRVHEQLTPEQEDHIMDWVYSQNDKPIKVDTGILKDSDGSTIQKQKVTTSGWVYQLHCFEFKTATLNTIVSKKEDGTDYNFATAKFYKLDNGSEVEITGDDLNQEFLDANCVKTVIDWEPTHDYDIIGGSLKQKDVPTEDVYLWVTGVPDVPAQYGGSKLFVSSVNLAYIGTDQGLRIDGRVAKYMPYSSTYHTNKFRLTLRHSAGFKHEVVMQFEIFKP